MLSPDPKEVAVSPGGSGGATYLLDFGQPVALDSVFLGYHSATGPQEWAFVTSDSAGNQTGTLIGTTAFAPSGYGPPYHSFVRAANPLTSRYWSLYTSAKGGPAFYIGVLAVGLALQFQYGTEWGAGRSIDDTGTAERLFGGGFGIDDGVAAGGYQWTFGDLQPDELRKLYQLVRERRTTRSVLVVEDPDQTDGLNERLHWGLFRKLDAYERLDPLNTKWSLQVADWA